MPSITALVGEGRRSSGIMARQGMVHGQENGRGEKRERESGRGSSSEGGGGGVGEGEGGGWGTGDGGDQQRGNLHHQRRQFEKRPEADLDTGYNRERSIKSSGSSSPVCGETDRIHTLVKECGREVGACEEAVRNCAHNVEKLEEKLERVQKALRDLLDHTDGELAKMLLRSHRVPVSLSSSFSSSSSPPGRETSAPPPQPISRGHH